MIRRHRYTTEQIDWLRDHRAALAESQLEDAFAARFGVRISKKALSQKSRKRGINAHRPRGFYPGHKPWNSGIKGIQLSAGFQAAQFRPGARPYTELPIWSYCIRSGYWAIKVRDDAPTGYSRQDWEFLHRLTWQDHHGPIPDGHVVIMMDGDIDHCQDPANLLCVPRAILAIAARLRLSAITDPAQRRAAWEVVRLWAAAHALGRSGGLSYCQRVDLMGILAPFAPPPAAPPQDPATARRDAAARAVSAQALAARGLPGTAAGRPGIPAVPGHNQSGADLADAEALMDLAAEIRGHRNAATTDRPRCAAVGPLIFSAEDLAEGWDTLDTEQHASLLRAVRARLDTQIDPDLVEDVMLRLYEVARLALIEYRYLRIPRLCDLVLSADRLTAHLVPGLVLVPPRTAGLRPATGSPGVSPGVEEALDTEDASHARP